MAADIFLAPGMLALSPQVPGKGFGLVALGTQFWTNHLWLGRLGTVIGSAWVKSSLPGPTSYD